MKQEIFLNVQCYAIFKDMLAHLTRGIPGYGRRPEVNLFPAHAALAQACIEKDVSLAFKGAVPGELPAAEQSVIRGYLRHVHTAQTVAASSGFLMPFTLKVCHNDFETLHQEILLKEFVHYGIAPAGDNPRLHEMDRALAMYRQGTSMMVLAGFLREVVDTFGLDSAKAALHDAHAVLARRAALDIRDFAMHALMLDDPEQTAAARVIVHSECLAPASRFSGDFSAKTSAQTAVRLVKIADLKCANSAGT